MDGLFGHQGKERGQCGFDLVEQGSDGRAVCFVQATGGVGGGALDIGGEQLAQAGEAGIGALAAQQAQLDGVGQRRDGSAGLAETGGAIAQQGHQIDGGAVAGGERQNLSQQTPGGGLEQRHAGGVIDLNIEAAQFGGDAAGQIAVRGDDTDSLALAQGLTRRQRDGAGLFIFGAGANDRQAGTGVIELVRTQALGRPAGGILG